MCFVMTMEMNGVCCKSNTKHIGKEISIHGLSPLFRLIITLNCYFYIKGVKAIKSTT